MLTPLPSDAEDSDEEQGVVTAVTAASRRKSDAYRAFALYPAELCFIDKSNSSEARLPELHRNRRATELRPICGSDLAT